MSTQRSSDAWELAPSSAGWTPVLPAHWLMRRLKILVRERTEKGSPHEPLLAATQRHGVIRKDEYEQRTVTALRGLETFKLVDVDDFVISLRSFEGGIERAHHRGIISPAYTVLRASDPALVPFLAVLFKSAPFRHAIRLSVTGIREGQNVNYARLACALVPVPPVDEQRAMVKWLHSADSHLKAAVQAKRGLVALLAERRTVVAHRLATGGVAALEDRRYSGIPWFGDVPATWDVRPAKWLYREVNERSERGEEQLMSVSHLTGVTPRAAKNVTMFMAASYAGHKLCRPGDLVINTMWAWMGALGVAEDTGIVSPAYGVYRPLPDSPLEPAYADLLLRTRPYIDEYTCRSTGIRSSRLRLYPDRFLRVPIVCPPVEEQREIVGRMRDATRDLDATIAATLREIELLKEYRTRLIADVVTGRRDVRAEAADLPDVNPDELDSLLSAASAGDDVGEDDGE